MKAIDALLARLHGALESARLAMLRSRMHHCGHGVILYPHVEFHGPEALDIGDDTSIASFVHIWCGGRVVIGSNCMIGSHTAISSLTHDHRQADMRQTIVARPVHIEDGVWIGSHAVILPGVRVGRGAVVGAGSVVTSDVPAGAIVHGVPAKVQGYREAREPAVGEAAASAPSPASATRPPSQIEVLDHVLKARPRTAAQATAIDVGAHVGRFAEALLSSALATRVVAFEPNPANLPELEKRAAGDSRIRVIRAAVGAAPGRLELHCDRDTATGSLLAYDAAYRPSGEVTHVGVDVVTLDDCRRRGLLGEFPVALLKVDTQGHDLAVLEGARELLAADRPVVMSELIHIPLYAGQAEPAAIQAFMAVAGYRLHALLNVHATAEGRLAFCDAVFVPSELELPASQSFVQLDNHESYEAQIRALEQACRERLDLIERLDAELKRRAR